MKPRLLVPFLLFTSCFSLKLAGQEIDYILSMPEPQTHYFEVQMKISGVDKGFLDLKMATWTPGSYLIREFARNVETVSATDPEGNALSITKINKNTWRITDIKNDQLDIRYRVYAYELSVRTSFLNSDHGYVNGASVFMYVDDWTDRPSRLQVIPYSIWQKVSTGLPRKPDEKGWVYSAADFDTLVDSPLEIGNHDVFTFQAAGVKHEVAMFGKGNYQEAKLLKDMARVVEVCSKVFGENPNKEFTFIIHNLNHGGGGLEHANSTTLQVNRWIYGTEAGYQKFLGLVTHEYFHLWNVKRIRPRELGPFDYENENYTRLLWVMEGFTSYYDEILLVPAGLLNQEEYLKTLSSKITFVENTPGNKIQSVSEASFDAWIKAYRQNENSNNTTISYYSKGALLALVLDLEIIQQTGASKNLDDVMRYLYKEFFQKKDVGFTESEFQTSLEKVSGIKLNDFFEKYVYGTQPIPYGLFLKYAGLNLISDKGIGVRLGIQSSQETGRVMVKKVFRGTPAYSGGINAGDELISIDGFRLIDNTMEEILGSYNSGDIVEVLVAREGHIKRLQIRLSPDRRARFNIETKDKFTSQEKKIYQKWMRLGNS